jgi:hypothetical protein
MHVDSKERHRTGRIGWLRAAVLGANDGILSTSSLVLGVATAHATHSNVLALEGDPVSLKPVSAPKPPLSRNFLREVCSAGTPTGLSKPG